MSSSPAIPSQHRRQASNASLTSSLASGYTSPSSYFPDSRSSTVTSASSKSSRFSWQQEKQQQQQQQPSSPLSKIAISPPLASQYSPASAMEPPDRFAATPPPNVRHSISEFTPRADSPSSALVRPGPSIRRGHGHTASISSADINSLRNSSVSHFRTLSTISKNGVADFTIPAVDDVAGMHGRKRLQKAPTDQKSSWERLNWMDKRRKYIQAYEYLCHIGEAKE